MSLKDLFGKTSEKIVSEKQLQELYEQVDSEGHIEQLIVEKERFLPKVDFSSPINFAKYGSAEKYYSDAIKNIYQRYPYDGSYKEKVEWKNSSSQFDIYVLENVYPLSTGYVNLNSGSVTSYTTSSVTYRSSSLPQFIRLKGGPNAGIDNKFENGNIYDLSKNLESNLGITSLGNTVEFWFKDNIADTNPATDYAYCYFDLWNNILSGSSNYTRLTLERDSSNQFLITYVSGTSGVVRQPISYEIDKNNWHHYAFTFNNNDNNNSDLDIALYVDGELVTKQTFNNKGNINLAYSYAIQANIGAYIADVNGNSSSYWNGLGTSFGSFDEFRFWKISRTSQQISRFWFTNVGGGSNTDDANKNLGIYYKFNEGIVDSTTINDVDKSVLDYSGRISNGTIINYNTNTRNTGSAINIFFNDEKKELKDPIIYSTNPLVQNILQEYTISGSLYDQENNSSIYKSLPSWIVEESEEKNLPDLSNLVQIISSYFDTLHIQIENLPKIKDVNYVQDQEKPKPFINKILNSYAFDNIELFNDATFLEEVLSRNETTQFSKKLDEIKNTIYQNIYNNLAYIYKSKGTEKSFRNLIRCFGIDDELLKINIYGNNSEYELTNRYAYTTVKKKFVDFNNVDRYTGTVFQKNVTGDNKTKGHFISNSKKNGFNENYIYNIPLTLETEIIFPKKVLYDSPIYNIPDFSEISLFGMHTANQVEENFSWGFDNFNFQVYAIKRNEESKDVYFKLTGSLDGYSFNVTSSWYNNVYDNQKWNLAVRIYPEKLFNAYTTSGSNANNYFIELVGNNYLVDQEVNNSFVISASIPEEKAKNSLNVRKRLYIGAHYQDFNGSVLQKSDVKISSVRFWYDYLNNEELKAHAINASSYGRQNPNWQPHFIQQFGSGSVIYNTNDISASTNTITKADTLALHWNFETVTGSNETGEFVVIDASSGSSHPTTDYGLNWFADLAKRQFTGLGYGFPANDSNVINKEYIYSAKLQNPEVLTSNDLIDIPETDNNARFKSNKPVSYYLSFEKSMAQVINGEILNWFATLKDFNNLFGNPLNKYQKEYKDLTHIRKIFFEKVSNTPDFEKFLEFYKWIDSSISMMLTQLAPASSNYSDKVRNIVESHLLERNKYDNKLPTIEFKKIDNIKIINTGNASTDPFIDSLAPYNPTGSLWLKKRAVRTLEPVNTPGESQNDIDREIIRQVIYSNNINSSPLTYDSLTNQVYEYKNDVVRFFSKQYKIVGDTILNLEAVIQANGTENIEINTTLDINTASVDPQSGSNFGKTYKNTIGNYQNTYEYLQLTSRTNNNKYLVNAQGDISSSSGSSGLGFFNSTLPSRDVFKQIFVERFNAPGGAEVNSRGALNNDSEEYSAYNNLNYRNFRVRKNLNSWLAESSSINADNPSYHKVNKNTYYVFSSSNDTTGKAKYDNEFITRQIPRSDMQYSWLTASVLIKPSSSFYFTEYDNLKIYNSQSLQFVSATLHPDEELITDYLGFNWLFVFNVNTSSNLISTINPPHYINVDLTAHQTNQYFLKLNGPYGYPSWKQINNRNNRLSIISRKNNNILVQDKSTEKQRKIDNIFESYINRIEPTFTSYREPPVMFNKPMVHKVNSTGSTDTIILSSPYDNNKYYFSNDFLMQRLNLKLRDEPQLHDILLNIDVNNLFNPKPEYIGAKYSIQVFPSKEYAGLKEIQTRNNYEEIAGTGSNGYDRNVATIRSYWKNNISDRLTTNAYNSSTKTGSINSLNIPSFSSSFGATSSYTAGAITNINFWNEYTGGYIYNITNFKDNFLGTSSLNTAILTASSINANVYSSFFALDASSSVSTSRTNVFGSSSYESRYFISESKQGDLFGLNIIDLRNILIQPSGTYSYNTAFLGNAGQAIGQYEVFKYDKNYHFIRPTPSLGYNINYPHFRLFSLFSGSLGFNPIYYDTKLVNKGFVYKTDVISGKKPFYNSYDEYISYEKPLLKNYSIVPEYKISDHMEYYIKEANGNFRAPLTSSYLSVVGSDLEFNEIKGNNTYNKTTPLDNFLLESFVTNKTTTNSGINSSKISITADAIIKLLPYKGFYPSERIVQIIDLFQKSLFNLSDGDINNFYITSNGKTKNTYVDSNINKYFNTVNGSPLVQQIQTILQPLYAPGIFFNTIKSGIAVDWPVYFGPQETFGAYSSSNPPIFYNTASMPNTSATEKNTIFWYVEKPTGSLYLIDKEPTSRLQFEDILDLSKAFVSTDTTQSLFYLDPTRINLDSFSGSDRQSIRYPSYDINNPYRTKNKSTTFNDNRYTLAINNYLGEIPKFFLENGSLTNFISQPQSKWKDFNSGVEYTMDLVLSKDDDLKLVLENSGSRLAHLDAFINFIYFVPSTIPSFKIPAASTFGPPVRYFNYSSGSILETLAGVFLERNWEANMRKQIWWTNSDQYSSIWFYHDPAYAPYVPPYYYGDCRLKVSFKPTETRAYTLGEIFENITLTQTNKNLESLFITSSIKVGSVTSNTRYSQVDGALTRVTSSYQESPAYRAAMPLTSSINIKLVTNIKDVEYDSAGVPITIKDVNAYSSEKWVIQTKFETPVLNFNNTNNSIYTDLSEADGIIGNAPFSGSSGSGDIYDARVSAASNHIGMWSGYGFNDSNSNIKLLIEEPVTSNNLTQSLAAHVGFTQQNAQSVKKIGQVADKKIIKEALVLIPYIASSTEAPFPYAKTIEILNENGKTTNNTSETNIRYFQVDTGVINELLDLDFNNVSIDILDKRLLKIQDKSATVDIEAVRESVRGATQTTTTTIKKPVVESSIIKTINCMREYNIPSHLDWTTFRGPAGVNPFVMYFIEFEHELDKQDLVDIWQGLMPKISLNGKNKKNVLSHDMNKYEFFHNLRLPKDVRWKVFKVKKKANDNYYKLVNDSKDDNRYKFKFSNSQDLRSLEYSYNWPYDFFSMIELVNISVDLELEEKSIV